MAVSKELHLRPNAPIFNHGQIWQVRTTFNAAKPGDGPDNTSFGTPSEYRDPRTLQLAMKLTF